jgi:CspA family cold shock protein
MQTGTVSRFNNIKGYGFINSDDLETEVFVHFSEVNMTGHKELKIGQRVSYVLMQGDKGPYATNVQNIDSTIT